MQEIKIDYTKIPAFQLKLLCSTLAEAVDRFYSDPKNIERFEKWINSEEGKAYLERQEQRRLAQAKEQTDEIFKD